MARGKHSGESRFFGDENNYSRRSRRVEEYDSYEEEQEDYDNNDYEEDDEYDDYDDEKRINIKKIFIIILILFLIVEIFFVVRKFLSAKNGKTNENNNAETNIMTSAIEGYKVHGKIKIDKIGVEQYILDSAEDKALQNGVCKLYGGTLNSLGNFCIAGHNFDNVFSKLSELEIGDTFIVIDRNNKETKYEVKDSYSVEPDNLEVLIQNASKVEITLITCENGSTKRLVIKAEEVKN